MKIWQIKDRPKALMLTDEELILAIKNGLLKGDDVLLSLELKEEVDTTLSYLNNEEKELFIRYYLEGETLKEISLSEKINISSLYSKLSRGRKKIRESISKSGGN